MKHLLILLFIIGLVVGLIDILDIKARKYKK